MKRCGRRAPREWDAALIYCFGRKVIGSVITGVTLLLWILFWLVPVSNVMAAANNTGELMGRVVAAQTSVPIAGAKIHVSDAILSSGGDGRFSVILPAGHYMLTVVAPGYAPQTVTLSIEGDETRSVRVALNRNLAPEDPPAGDLRIELGKLVVTPLLAVQQGSQALVQTMQRSAEGVVDIIGAERMARLGASSAVDALRWVGGVTVSDDRFVVIRGQPERYTFTLWNGSQLPSPDPIERVVPLDLFPTDVLSNVVVQKSYTADRPGAFAGGLVAMNTRTAPGDTFLKVSVGTGYNSVSTGEEGLTDEGGAYDWLGFDDGTRALPDGVAAVPDLSELPHDEQIALARTFSDIWAVRGYTLRPDLGLSLTGGGHLEALGGDIGILGLISYGRKDRFRNMTKRTFATNGQGDLIEQSQVQVQRT
ncbi:MAG: carboxypeptidase regulatory-like domain-containing protein, partial [Nitrosospira sp.]|nr:carboxypeptidase regulatory-like domain-containing protein [Nitrosospira sp.]